MTELFAVVNGINACYEIHGEGYPLMLIHGYGGTKEGWFTQVPALSEEFKVITPDNRGAGGSDHPNIPYTMEMYADDINGLMEYLKIEKAHVIGASLGGMIVQNFILKYPNRVNKFVLINTFPGFPNQQGLEMYKNSQIQYFKELKENPIVAFFKAARQGFTREYRKMMEENPKRRFYDLWSAEDIINGNLEHAYTPQDTINGANAIAGHNTLDRLHEIKSETLVLCAEKDRIANMTTNKKIHERIPNSVFKIIKDAGHNSPFEKAPEVNKVLLDFLKN